MSEAHSYGKGVDGFDQTFGLPMRRSLDAGPEGA
jgi:hypothetical protein